MIDIEMLNVGLALVEAYAAQDVHAIGKVWVDVLSESQESDTAPHLRSQSHTDPMPRSQDEKQAEYDAQERAWKARKQEIFVTEYKLSREIALRNR